MFTENGSYWAFHIINWTLFWLVQGKIIKNTVFLLSLYNYILSWSDDQSVIQLLSQVTVTIIMTETLKFKNYFEERYDERSYRNNNNPIVNCSPSNNTI